MTEQKPLGHYRLASAKQGDDATLTRYVRTDRGAHPPRKHQPRLVGIGTPKFVDESRTKFGKSVKPVSAMRKLLVSGHSNVKIGRDVRKGRLKGYWIYTLSLEERATCPDSCKHWQTCYGNNMPFAKRIDHTDAEFLPRLETEIAELLAVRGREGILVRLHALGDFYSTEYVAFWKRMLETHKRLSIFGYTARNPLTDPIGVDIEWMNAHFGKQCMIRHSDGGWPGMSTVSIGSRESCPDDAFICPEQTGQTKCCATCGACWSTSKNVAFLAH